MSEERTTLNVNGEHVTCVLTEWDIPQDRTQSPLRDFITNATSERAGIRPVPFVPSSDPLPLCDEGKTPETKVVTDSPR